MAETTYTTWLIKLNSWTLIQGTTYPDYENPFMITSNRYKNVVVPYWFEFYGIKRVQAFLYNDVITRTSDITITLKINRSWVVSTLYTLTFAVWVTSITDTTVTTVQSWDKFYIEMTSIPADCPSAIELFFNYSDRETTGQFSNNISFWFEQSLPKIPVGVIKEKATDRDLTPLCYPSVGTNNSGLYLELTSWDVLTVQRRDPTRTMRIYNTTTERVLDKLAISLNCSSSTWIGWTWTAAPSANVSCMLNTTISWTENVFIASRWLRTNWITTDDWFRLQRYSYNSTTKVLTFVNRSSAYRTMKTARSGGWIFALRIGDTGWSFSWKIITSTCLRQQAGVDSKIGWLLVFNQDCTLANTFKWIGNTDASLYGIYWPGYVYEEVSWWATTAISCISHVTDTTAAVAPYPDKIACLWKYDSTGAITAQYDISINSAWTFTYQPMWVTQYGATAYVFGSFCPDPVWAPTTVRPFIVSYDKDWVFIEETICRVNEACVVTSLDVDANYMTYVVRNVSDSKDVVMRKNLSTLGTEIYKEFTWFSVFYAKSIAYNNIFIHWASSTNSGSCYGYVYNPWAFNTAWQPENNFTIASQTAPASGAYSNYFTALLWGWFSITAASANPTYTQALTTHTLWWTWTSNNSNNTVFYSSL